jgi:hypothetical protein
MADVVLQQRSGVVRNGIRRVVTDGRDDDLKMEQLKEKQTYLSLSRPCYSTKYTRHVIYWPLKGMHLVDEQSKQQGTSEEGRVGLFI